MSSAAPSSRVRRRDGDDEGKSVDASQPREVNQTAAAVEVVGQTAFAADPDGSPAVQPQPPSAGLGVQPLPEQFGQRKKPRRSARLACPLNNLAVVELQLVLQFLDTKSKLIAARCSRSLLQAADHPFAWQGPSVWMNSDRQPSQLGSLIRQSLLRHAPIELKLGSDLPAAEVAAIPRLRELIIDYGISADVALDVLVLPSLKGLQTLRLVCELPLSTLRLLATLPALHTLQFSVWNESEDWSWLPAMPALTHLDIVKICSQLLRQPAVEAIGQCARLQTLRLRGVHFKTGAFARLFATPALRRLRHLDIYGLDVAEVRNVDGCRAAFSSLAGLESLRLKDISRVDLLLPQLAHAPALRTLTVACRPDDPYVLRVGGGPTIPSRGVLRRVLAAAPLLAVRLEVAASIDEWRHSYSLYGRVASFAEYREQMDEQWRELQRMGAKMERVTIVPK